MVDEKHEMLNIGTPVEHHAELDDLFVKREDQACREPGPQFSKTRGVFEHVRKKMAEGFTMFGVLDTYHSQAGHAVALACQLLGAECTNFYPEYKNDPGHRAPQERAAALGAQLFGLQAGMSAVLFHRARGLLRAQPNSYMMPNALKLDESVTETASEVGENCSGMELVIVPVSSATIAAGVIRGYVDRNESPRFILHMGYSRKHRNLRTYVEAKVGIDVEELPAIDFVDEGFKYKDTARRILELPFPCNHYYDMKTMDWWMREGRARFPKKKVLFWNVG